MEKYIKLRDVNELIARLLKEPAYQHEGEDFYSGVCNVECEIQTLPCVEIEEPKHGEWRIETEYYDDEYSECNARKVFACSLCGRTERTKQPYCNCGAKMS